MDINLNTCQAVNAKIRQGLLEAEPLWTKSPCLVAAVSGGSDSTVMLYALAQLQSELGFRLVACHVNHGLRGADSMQDEASCRLLCAALGVNLHVFKAESDITVPSEARLRDTRYGFLAQAAALEETNFVVTGHTLDDQVETMLFRLFRGTSSTGMVGIKSVSRSKNGLFLLRPLLRLSRHEIEQFLDAQSISARTDLSNLESGYARNFIRNKIIPLTEEKFPSLKVQLARYHQSLAVDEIYLDEQTDAVLSTLGGAEADRWALDRFKSAHPAIRRRMIAKALNQRGIEVSFERLEAILSMVNGDGIGKQMSLNGSFGVAINSEYLLWLQKRSQRADADVDLAVSVPGSTLIEAIGMVLAVERIAEPNTPLPSNFPKPTALEAFFDLTSVDSGLRLRNRKAGDKIQPFGMTKSVSLKKYIHTHRAKPDLETESLDPLTNRGSMSSCLVLCDAEEVLWVPGVGMSNKVKAVSNRPLYRLSLSSIL